MKIDKIKMKIKSGNEGDDRKKDRGKREKRKEGGVLLIGGEMKQEGKGGWKNL